LRKKQYKEAPETLGEHLRKQRTLRGSLQREVAAMLGVNESTYLLWEHDRERPFVRYLPKIIDFLGFDPFSRADTLGQRIRGKRRKLGLNQEMAAKLIGVDEGTLRRWESGEWQPTCRTRAKVARFLAEHELGSVS